MKTESKQLEEILREVKNAKDCIFQSSNVLFKNGDNRTVIYNILDDALVRVAGAEILIRNNLRDLTTPKSGKEV